LESLGDLRNGLCFVHIIHIVRTSVEKNKRNPRMCGDSGVQNYK